MSENIHLTREIGARVFYNDTSSINDGSLKNPLLELGSNLCNPKNVVAVGGNQFV